MKVNVNSRFDFFCFIKNVLVAANKSNWTHQPEHDRYIADQITICFCKHENDKEIATLDLMFDLCEMDIVKSGVARWMNHEGARVVSGKDIPFVEIEDFFDPVKMLSCGKVEKV